MKINDYGFNIENDKTITKDEILLIENLNYLKKGSIINENSQLHLSHNEFYPSGTIHAGSFIKVYSSLNKTADEISVPIVPVIENDAISLGTIINDNNIIIKNENST